MRLAVVTPLDPRGTGVADYSRELLPYLARTVRETVAVFSQDKPSCQEDMPAGWAWHPSADLDHVARTFDLIIYQMGNSPAHDFMAPFLFRYPGLVVMHDLSLHDFFARQASPGHPAAYVRAFGFACGSAGSALARSHLQTRSPVDYPQYLLSEWLAARSPGVIVHSRHAADLLRDRCPSARIWTAPMPMPLPAPVAQDEARRLLGITRHDYVIVVFGMLNLTKCPVEILEAVQRLRADGISARVVFVGRENSPFELAPEIRRLQLEASVTHLGFADMVVARQWMFAADVAVGLRQHYFGETSASALRVLATGRPMILTEIGAFAELPDAACIKLPFCKPDLARSLYAALAQLYRDPARRQAMGQAARDYVAREHDPGRVAARYAEVAQTLLNMEPEG